MLKLSPKWKRFFYAGVPTEVVLWFVILKGYANTGGDGEHLIIALLYASALAVSIGIMAAAVGVSLKEDLPDMTDVRALYARLTGSE